jgi:hypothetical protein
MRSIIKVKLMNLIKKLERKKMWGTMFIKEFSQAISSMIKKGMIK